YRLRGEFHVLRRGGTVSLGFYRKHTYQTLPIDACLIHVEAIERALPAFAHAAEDPGAARVTALQVTWAPGTSDLLWAPYPAGSGGGQRRPNRPTGRGARPRPAARRLCRGRRRRDGEAGPRTDRLHLLRALDAGP